MKPAPRPNPAPSSSSSQLGTIIIGAGAGLAVCAILSTIISQYQQAASAAAQQVAS